MRRPRLGPSATSEYFYVVVQVVKSIAHSIPAAAPATVVAAAAAAATATPVAVKELVAEHLNRTQASKSAAAVTD